eukprot:TRINITY_DN111295_c0_g1_i1.p1 TRINITY_DN111295_c0_g1~~TRINITY_DN111295_c0_g1_i1.p1  ORF type:complete len:303 (+),score=55.30 TRINITY_DN111295_c0_g1_i1:82-990(+)
MNEATQAWPGCLERGSVVLVEGSAGYGSGATSCSPAVVRGRSFAEGGMSWIQLAVGNPAQPEKVQRKALPISSSKLRPMDAVTRKAHMELLSAVAALENIELPDLDAEEPGALSDIELQVLRLGGSQTEMSVPRDVYVADLFMLVAQACDIPCEEMDLILEGERLQGSIQPFLDVEESDATVVLVRKGCASIAVDLSQVHKLAACISDTGANCHLELQGEATRDVIESLPHLLSANDSNILSLTLTLERPRTGIFDPYVIAECLPRLPKLQRIVLASSDVDTRNIIRTAMPKGCVLSTLRAL